jgi:hypothetical protein
VLDFMSETYPDQRQEATGAQAVTYPDWCRVVMNLLPPDDLYAVADFLSMLHRLGLHDQARELADRVIAHVSDMLHSPDEMLRQDALLPLLATVKRLGLDEQADKLSAVLGYTGSHWKRRNIPVDGRFS